METENQLEKTDKAIISQKEIAIYQGQFPHPDILKGYRDRLTAKVSELLNDTSVDETRIATEVTIFADKICVDEEIVRLKSHIDQMKGALNGSDAVGRKLDFLSQELNREANTILSKSSDVDIANTGIETKTIIEKIREQIQNIE